MIEHDEPFETGSGSVPSRESDGLAAATGLIYLPKVGGEITLRRLKIFWAVAHSATLTRAAKLLNVSQPTLSQQLTAFEAAIGSPLFDRRSNHLVLTETGDLLLRKAETVLRSAQAFEDSLPTLAGSTQQTLRIAGVATVMRVILPVAMAQLIKEVPSVEFDIHECAPAEILDLLYGRRVNIGLIAANSVPEVSAGFQQIPIMQDPFVLAVPEGIDLSGVIDPDGDLDPGSRAIMNSVIQFVFGTQHSSRIQDWFDLAIPRNHVSMRVRSFELALDLVAAGLGVCVVPALTALGGEYARTGIRLYEISLEPRRIVAMVPSQYLRVTPYSPFLTALQTAGQGARRPLIRPAPPFIASQSERLG